MSASRKRIGACGLFDRYLVVDWSAANAPARGANSIWICESARSGRRIRTSPPENPSTRDAAEAMIGEAIAEALAAGRRLFAGFDFPFGYPEGAAAAIAGAPCWSALWDFLHDAISDDATNRSNRYAVAARINREAFGEPVYWGRPASQAHSGLPERREKSPKRQAMEYRRAEKAHPPAKSVWQLAYAGAAGSQALLGIARLRRLRAQFGGRIAVWPFETRFDEDLSAPIVFAEIYPSLFAVKTRAGEPRDRAQVRTLAQHFAKQDACGAFAEALAAPSGLGARDRAAILSEEGWIVGTGERG